MEGFLCVVLINKSCNYQDVPRVRRLNTEAGAFCHRPVNREQFHHIEDVLLRLNRGGEVHLL